jgi:hypothetical protein
MALQEVLFVSEEKLKSFTSINNNVSPLDLIPYVLQSQDLYLQNFIGATFYFQLKEQVLTGTVSTANQFVLDNYIGGALCNWALQIALPFLKYKIFNKAVLAPTSENSDAVTLEEIKFLQEQCRDTAQFYMKRCVEWMTLHPAGYPLYITPNVLDGILPQRGNPYSQSLVTPARPYAWKKKMIVSNRDSANIGWYNNDGFCLECGPNSVSPQNV